MKIASSVVPFERIAPDFHGHQVQPKSAPLQSTKKKQRARHPFLRYCLLWLVLNGILSSVCSERRNLWATRLTSVTLPGSNGTVSFVYDPFGRRVKKVSSSGTSIFAYDGDNIIEEANSSGTVVARYSQGLNIDEPLAILRSSATSFYNADGLGSITSLANTSGTLTQTYTFDSFGKQTASSGSLTNSFQYTARESDTETGLYYYRARYYDPNTGRFLSEDPISWAAGPNFYRYSDNDPSDLVDEFGLAPGDWWDPRTPGNVWNQLNPFNVNGSTGQTGISIWDSLSGMAKGDWQKVRKAYDYGPLGQTGCNCPVYYYSERGAVAGAGISIGIAATLIVFERTGLSDIGESQIGIKGGEITLTRPGCKTPDIRVNPFGSRNSSNPLSRRPHWHQRGPGGIGRHRPWE
jgi:RHS repeat-associated protein